MLDRQSLADNCRKKYDIQAYFALDGPIEHKRDTISPKMQLVSYLWYEHLPQ